MKILVPSGMAGDLREFFENEKIPLEPTAEGKCDMRIVQTTERLESDLSILYSGGSITCATARQLAGKIGIELGAVGKLLDYLDVKIRACELGCFK